MTSAEPPIEGRCGNDQRNAPMQGRCGNDERNAPIQGRCGNDERRAADTRAVAMTSAEPPIQGRRQ
jgi:uncharacterized low-complexity protein